jgi:hypothetical protein
MQNVNGLSNPNLAVENGLPTTILAIGAHLHVLQNLVNIVNRIHLTYFAEGNASWDKSSIIHSLSFTMSRRLTESKTPGWAIQMQRQGAAGWHEIS